MEILIQIQNKQENVLDKNQSTRNLSLFSLYERKFSSEINSFKHYLMVIGYSGGMCQEECSYVIHGSNINNSKIVFTFSTFPIYWDKEFLNNELKEISTEIDEDDNEVFKKFQEVMSQYVVYDDKKECYLINAENHLLRESSFYSTPTFPTKRLAELKKVYWPFSISC
jgi:hypothetical protein